MAASYPPQLLEEAPEVYRDCGLIMEMVDWLSFQLTGRLRRNRCCAGFKSFWPPGRGHPPSDFFTGLDERLADLHPEKLRWETTPPWEPVGELKPDWARRLGLTTHMQVSAGIIDAYAGVLGSGVTEADSQTAHRALTREAERLRPGESGLLALDWWNGQRTPLVNDRLTGVMADLTLHTEVAEQYRALLEAAVFGGRVIVEVFEKAGLKISEVTACGGIARKNTLMMQIYADMLNRPIRMAVLGQCPALAAIAAGLFQSPSQAVSVISSRDGTLYVPKPENAVVYQVLYRQYQTLSRWFGGSGVMVWLTALRVGGGSI